MASIGELTATVRADISGYVQPMKQVVATNQQVAQSATSVGKTAEVFKKVQHVAVLLSAESAGLGNHIGQLVAKFGMLAGGSGILIAVAGAIALAGAAFRKLTEDTKKHQEAIDDLQASYDELTGKAIRARLEAAQADVASAQALVDMDDQLAADSPGSVNPRKAERHLQDLTAATALLRQANRAWAEHINTTIAPALERQNNALKEQKRIIADITQGFKSGGKPIDQDKADALHKQAQEYDAIKRGALAAAAAERERAKAFSDATVGLIGKDTSKQDFLDRQNGAIAGARDAANGLARAFMSAFSDNEGTIMDRVGSVLKAALLGAIEKLIAEEIFKNLLAAITGGASKGVPILSDLPVVGGLFGAPSAAGAVGGGGSIVVPLDALPRPLSPVEYARDAMHQAVWVETARTAQANGVNLQPRFR